jgi:GAF domain-containing protein
MTDLGAPERLRALDALALLDTPAEQAFDRLTELAAATLGVPVSLISLVTDDRQFFKSECGLPDIRETPLSHSFCQHVVAAREPVIVSDARKDERLLDNLAIRDLGVIAYLGVPLITREGHAVGTLCVIDHQPRIWTDDEISLVKDVASAVVTEITVRSTHGAEHTNGA